MPRVWVAGEGGRCDREGWWWWDCVAWWMVSQAAHKLVLLLCVWGWHWCVWWCIADVRDAVGMSCMECCGDLTDLCVRSNLCVTPPKNVFRFSLISSRQTLVDTRHDYSKHSNSKSTHQSRNIPRHHHTPCSSRFAPHTATRDAPIPREHMYLCSTLFEAMVHCPVSCSVQQHPMAASNSKNKTTANSNSNNSKRHKPTNPVCEQAVGIFDRV